MMKIDIRTTHNFVEVKVDEVNTTIFYDSDVELDSFILNLLTIADTLSDKTPKNLLERIVELGY